MKPGDLNSSSYIDFNVESNDKDSEFEVDNYIRISKCKNIFPKDSTPNWSEEVFAIKKNKNTVPWTLLKILTVKKLLEHFMKRDYKKQIK